MSNDTDKELVARLREAAIRNYWYDEETGFLHHRIDRGNISIGEVAGESSTKGGYIRVGVSGRNYKAHRIIWLMKTGEWPKLSIDHIDRNRANNSWKNLRLATPRQQQANITLSKRNTSGVRGVYFDNGKWRAKLAAIGAERMYLGSYSTIEEAKAAYDEAAKKHFGEYYQPAKLPERAALAGRDGET